MVLLLEPHGEVAAQVFLRRIQEQIKTPALTDDALDARAQILIGDVVQQQGVWDEGVENLVSRLGLLAGLAVDKVLDHRDHRVRAGGGHVPVVAADARVHLKEQRSSVPGIDLHVEVREAAVPVFGQQGASIAPQPREVLGDHGHGVPDHRRRVVFEEDTRRTDQRDFSARVHVGGDRAHRCIIARNQLLYKEGIAEARSLQGPPQLGEFLGRVDEPDLALALKLEHIVRLALRGLSNHRETEGNLRSGPGLVLHAGEVYFDRARRSDPRTLARAGELGLIGQPIHDLLGRERQRVVTRERLHIPCHERRENVVVGHQDELLIRMLARDRHEGVQELRVTRMSAHVADIKKVRTCDRLRRLRSHTDTPTTESFVETAPNSVHSEVSSDNDGQDVFAWHQRSRLSQIVDRHATSLAPGRIQNVP